MVTKIMNRSLDLPRYMRPGTVLTRAKVYDLIKSFQKAGDKKALETLVKHNLGLVYSIASRFEKRSKHLKFEDLIQEGIFGLIQAIQKFDTTSNNNLSTYAVYWIEQSIRRAIDEAHLIHIPVHALEALRRGSISHCARLALNAQRFFFLDEPVKMEEGSMQPILFDGAIPTPEDLLCQGSPDMDLLLLTVSPREREILKLRFKEDPLTLEEVSDLMGLTRERVRQIQNSGLKKLKSFMLTGIPSFPYTLCMRHPQGPARLEDLLNPEERTLLQLLTSNEHALERKNKNRKKPKAEDTLKEKALKLFIELYPNVHQKIAPGYPLNFPLSAQRRERGTYRK